MIPAAGWIALGIAFFAHVIASVWWASHMNTLLGILVKQNEAMARELISMKSNYVTKEEFAYRIANSDKEHVAMWKEIDEAKSK